MGIPAILWLQNAREEKQDLFVTKWDYYIGLNPTDEIIEGTLNMYLRLSKGSRESFQRKLLSHDLRGGRKRVMGLINSL